MKLHNGFKQIELSNVARQPRLSISKHGLRFNKSVSAMLKYAEFVKVYIDNENKMLAVVQCKADASGATPFYRPNNKKCKTPSWTNKRFLGLIARIGQLDLEKASVTIKPQLLEDGGVYFDFNEASPVNKK